MTSDQHRLKASFPVLIICRARATDSASVSRCGAPPEVSPENGSVGDYTWNGVGGTHFWVDPKEDMFVVFMIQSPRQRQHYMTVIRNMIYAAIEK